MYLETDLIDIFFLKVKAQIKVHIPVDTSHSLPLARTLGMAGKTGKSTRCW